MDKRTRPRGANLFNFLKPATFSVQYRPNKGPSVPLVPVEARHTVKSEFKSFEPISPRIGCTGRIKRKNKNKASFKSTSRQNSHRNTSSSNSSMMFSPRVGCNGRIKRKKNKNRASFKPTRQNSHRNPSSSNSCMMLRSEKNRSEKEMDKEETPVLRRMNGTHSALRNFDWTLVEKEVQGVL